jgi:DNA transposition AAA+ family ATPase
MGQMLVWRSWIDLTQRTIFYIVRPKAGRQAREIKHPRCLAGGTKQQHTIMTQSQTQPSAAPSQNRFWMLQETIKERLASGISLNKLARQLEISAAQLSNIRDGNEASVSEALVNRLATVLRLETWKLRETVPHRKIKLLCAEARENRRMLAVAAYTGAGKTTTLKHIEAKTPGTYYMLATALMNQVQFLFEICRACGIPSEGSKSDMVQAIVRSLNSQVDSLLIIDDAGKLNDQNLRLIQILFDRTEGACGIVLAGTEYLKKHIDKRARADAMGFRELKRRIGYWLVDLPTPDANTVRTFCGDFKITDDGAIRWICDRAHDFGTLKNILVNAEAAASKSGDSVTREMLTELYV